MFNGEKIDQVFTELRGQVNRLIREYGIPACMMVGILEIMKLDILTEDEDNKGER